MNKKFLFLSLFFVFSVVSPVFAQSQCKVPEIVFNKGLFNMFDETQEMYLGDVLAERMQSDFNVITDEEANRYLRQIGERLVKHLPPTNTKFQFYVVDLPTVNAFASAGGRIYVTRKMIAFARNEDELAGIIGHELGHATVRHVSANVSRRFKTILGIDKVGDKKDISDKYNDYLDKWKTKKVKFPVNHQDKEQIEADNIGIYAMTAAGYAPTAYAAILDRITQANGKTGNFLTDLFGYTNPEEKRLRETLKAVGTLPADCHDAKPAGENEAFERWQSYVVTTSTFQKDEKLSNLITKKTLTPYLRGDIRHLKFSPDGNYIIAQDDSGINLLKREPLSFLFRIDAADAKYAKFSPDSKHVVFQTFGLRVEKWSIEAKKAVFAKEVTTIGSCWQSALSPKGDYLVCYSKQANLDIISTENSELVLRKKNFYLPHLYEYWNWRYALDYEDNSEVAVMQLAFSPNGKYFMGSRVSYFSFGDQIQGEPIDWQQDPYVAYDLEARKEISLSGGLIYIANMPYAFLSDDKIIAQNREDADKSGIFEFPSGHKIAGFTLNANSFSPATGNLVVVRPTTKAPVGVYDTAGKKFILANRTSALDIYGDIFVSENKTGEIGLFKLDTTVQKVENLGLLQLPKNNFAGLTASSISPDFSFLAISEKSRGGVWNLNSGERRIYIRGFSGAFADKDGSVYADFPTKEKEVRAIAVMDPKAATLGGLGPVDTRNTKQYGKFLVRIKSKQDEKLDEKDKERKEEAVRKAAGGKEKDKEKSKAELEKTPGDMTYYVDENATLEVYDVTTRTLLWTRTFPNEVPFRQFNTTDQTAVFTWYANTKAAKAAIAANPELARRYNAMGDKEGDYYVQVLDSTTGQVKTETLIETGEGSFSMQWTFASGEWLTMTDTSNRILVYSLATGELLWRFVGSYAVVNPSRGVMAVNNVPGQISIYNLKTGKKIDELLFQSDLMLARFSEDGRKLFVLTRNQTYYIFNAEGFAAKS